MKKEGLLKLIEFALAVVKDDDSFQGSISWDAVEAPEGEDFLVNAVIRHGNKDGQGFVVLACDSVGNADKES